MKIALDFDNTFTADPRFWWDFVKASERRGHEVVIVTARAEDLDGINWAIVGYDGPPCPIVWCDGKPKRSVAKDIDVWIDDDPWSLIHGSQFTPEALAAWREQDVYRNPSDRRESTQGPTNSDGRPRLFSRRAGSGGGSIPQGK